MEGEEEDTDDVDADAEVEEVNESEFCSVTSEFE